VFPAANDNASGPATLIEVARALAARKGELRRSVVFAAFAGEEQGYIGSEAYVTRTATSPGRVESLGPELGQDTEILLMEVLGMEWERIEEMKAQGVIP